jgi:hypothetical protein
MIELPPFWIEKLIHHPETGMGYQIVTILLKDGRKIDQAIIDSGLLQGREKEDSSNLKLRVLKKS